MEVKINREIRDYTESIFFGVNISDLIHAEINFSAVIPLYLTKPSTAKGTAPNIHTQLNVSIPKYGFNIKYRITATKQAHTEKMNCLNDSKFIL